MSGLYAFGKTQMESAAINLTTDTIKAILIDSTYTANLGSDQYLSDIVSGKRVAPAVQLTSPALSGGVFSAANTLFPGVSNLTGNPIGSVVIYKHTGTESTSVLISVMDSGAGLPFLPIGADITVKWSTGANKIFAL